MSKPKTLTIWMMLLVSGGCLLLSLGQPLWGMRMEAPQYRDDEALRVAVFPSAMKGDLAELNTLNQYIGVHVPNTLPQFQWLPAALVLGAILPVCGAFFRGNIRTATLLAAPLLLSCALAGAALQAKQQMHDIGHNRDQKTVMTGVRDFTPPFLGSARIAQFQVTSMFGLGSALIGAALALQFTAAALSRPPQEGAKPQSSPQLPLIFSRKAS